MDLVASKLNVINSDCNFTENIVTNKYSEKVHKESKTNNYSNFLFCILDNFDILLSNTHIKDKKTIFFQRISQILSEIDENSSFNSYNFNEKHMKINKIQRSVQLCSKKNGEYLLSVLFFLNELYKTHFVIVDVKKNILYETCPKDYPKHYLMYNGNFYLQETITETYSKSSASFFDEDIKIKNVYQSYLKPVSNYKIDDLKTIAGEHGILIMNGSKSIKKQDIYDKINLTMLNKI